MEERTKVHVGLDVHKDSITVAAAEPGRHKARLIGKVVHDVPKLLKVLAKLGSVEELHIVYEAGPTGFGLQRALTARGYFCEVIAPSKTPRQSGNRVKTDARDGLELAEYSRVQKRGVQANKVCVAVAPELAGFVWAIGMQARRERGASA